MTVVVYFALKSGPFFLSRFPRVKADPKPFGGDLYESFAQAERALTSMRDECHDSAEAAILGHAQIVQLTVTETPARPGVTYA